MATAHAQPDPPEHHEQPDEPGVRIKIHPGLCEGWGNCHRFAPQIYPLDTEGKIDLHLLDVPAEYAYEATLGAGACPEEAITVIGAPFHHWAERRWREQDAAASDHHSR